MAMTEIVVDSYAVAGIEQRLDSDAADIAGAARDEHAHPLLLSAVAGVGISKMSQRSARRLRGLGRRVVEIRFKSAIVG